MMKVMICLSFVMLLAACNGSVKDCRTWPSGVSQSADGKEIAKYINEGHAAWQSCYKAVRG
jgi:hypothetical protein